MPITRNTLDLESIQTFSGFEHLILFFQVYFSIKAFSFSVSHSCPIRLKTGLWLGQSRTFRHVATPKPLQCCLGYMFLVIVVLKGKHVFFKDLEERY